MDAKDETTRDEAREHPNEESTTCPLTPRELEVLRLLPQGWTNAQIAKELCIAVDTVKFHTRNIYRKLAVASRAEATLVAIRQGWVKV